MIINFNNEQYEAEKIVKIDNNIIGYDGDKEVFSFRGIKDFSQFEGDFVEEPTEAERLMLAIAELDMQREIDKTETQLAIAELATILMGGE